MRLTRLVSATFPRQRVSSIRLYIPFLSYPPFTLYSFALMLALFLSVSSSFRSFSRMSLFLLFFFVWISWLRGPRPCCVLQCLFCYDFLQALERWTVHRPSLTTNYDDILFNGRHWIRLDGRIKQRKLCKRAKWMTLISSCFVFSLLTAVGH